MAKYPYIHMTLQLSSLVSRRESVAGRNSKQLSLATVFVPTSLIVQQEPAAPQATTCEYGTYRRCCLLDAYYLPQEDPSLEIV